VAISETDVLPPPGYVFKSPYFRYLVDRAWRKIMVQQDPKAFGARLAFCTSCGAAYLYSEGVRVDGSNGEPAEDEAISISTRARPHSPCHGTPPELVYDLESMFEAINFLAEGLQGVAESPKESLRKEPPAAAKPRSARQQRSQRGLPPPAAAVDPIAVHATDDGIVREAATAGAEA